MRMGQVALGLRSLIIKIAVFITMAALLAWALGGTLWPRPVSAIEQPVQTIGGERFAWQVTIRPSEGTVRYVLARQAADDWVPVGPEEPFQSVLPLRVEDVAGAEAVIAVGRDTSGAWVTLHAGPAGVKRMDANAVAGASEDD